MCEVKCCLKPTVTLGAILVMDNDGKRLIARYYTDDFPTVREQKVTILLKKPHIHGGFHITRADSQEMVTFESTSAEKK